MRYDQGWTKSHRKAKVPDRYSFFHGDCALQALWDSLISWANYEPGKAKVGRSQMQLERGQVWTTAKEVCEWLGISRKQLRSRLDLLVKNEKIGLHGDQHGYIITILNYDTYQAKDEDEGPTQGPEQGQHGANAGPTQGQHGASTGPRSEEVKKPRKKEAKKERRVALTPSEGQTPVEPAGATPVGEVWLAYAEAYATRYRAPDGQGIRPVWNARVGGQLTQLIARIGLDRAIELVRFYVSHNKASYISYSHPIGFCLQDAEGLCTQMARGSQTTESQGRAMDRTASNLQNASAALEQIRMAREG